MKRKRYNVFKTIVGFIVLLTIILAVINLASSNPNSNTCLKEIAQVECEDYGMTLLSLGNINLDITYICERDNGRNILLQEFKFKESEINYCKSRK